MNEAETLSHSPPTDAPLSVSPTGESPLISPNIDAESNRSPFHTYLHSKGLGECVQYFPAHMTLDEFSQLTEDKLIEEYKIVSKHIRQVILHTVLSSNNTPSSQHEPLKKSERSMDSLDDEISCTRSLPLSSSPILSNLVSPPRSPSPCKLYNTQLHYDSPRRLLHRTLSEDVKTRRRRDSMPQSQSSHALNTLSSSSIPHFMGSSNSMTHSCGPGSESSNLLKFRNSQLGHSAPNLTTSLRDVSSSRKNSGRSATPQKTSLSHCKGVSPQSSLSSPIDVKIPPNIPHPVQHIRKSSSDNRRWSVASVASSGYNTTTGSNVSLTSSSERVNPFFSCSPLQSASPAHQEYDQFNQSPGTERFSSSESNPAIDTDLYDTALLSPISRPRSRSFSPSRAMPLDTDSTFMMNSLYRERFPKAVKQMEEKLSSFIENNSEIPSIEELDGMLCFVHKQIITLAQDCLNKSTSQLLSSLYFVELSDKLETLTQEAKERSLTSYNTINSMVTKFLMIISRTARLLECLEFDPDEFLHLLEQAEGHAKKVIKAIDLPKYIIGKLGLQNDPMEALQMSSVQPDDDSDTSSTHLSSGSLELSLDTADSIKSRKPKQEPPTELDNVIPREEDLDYIKQISNGAYGTVWLVRHKATRQRFALKKLHKSNLILRNQVDQVFAERDILSFTDNPFVVTLYGTFETKKHFCMLLEYVEGGDCAALLKVVGCLNIETALLYFSETVLALEYIHEYGIVHRDLKPDNLLITAEGHIKLTDFGLSKMGIMNLTTNLVEGIIEKETRQFRDGQIFGTPEYIAPEVILRQGYGQPVDWWSMGIILYQFLVGVVPFTGETPEELFDHVLREEIDYHEEDEDIDMTPEAKSLISTLLERDPLRRMGTSGARQVMSHPIFNDTDWDILLRQKCPVSFQPQLSGEEDTSYFDLRSHYNHSDRDDDSETEDIMNRSFTSSSPRYSHMFERHTSSNTDHESVSRQSSDSSNCTQHQLTNSNPDSGNDSPRARTISSDKLLSLLNENEEKKTPTKTSNTAVTSTPKRVFAQSSLGESETQTSKDREPELSLKPVARSVSFDPDFLTQLQNSPTNDIPPILPCPELSTDPIESDESAVIGPNESGVTSLDKSGETCSRRRSSDETTPPHRTLRRSDAMSPNEADKLHNQKNDTSLAEADEYDLDVADFHLSDSVFPTTPENAPTNLISRLTDLSSPKVHMTSSSESASSSSANSPAACLDITHSLPLTIEKATRSRFKRPSTPPRKTTSHLSRNKHPGNLLIPRLSDSDKRPRSRTAPIVNPEAGHTPEPKFSLPALAIATGHQTTHRSAGGSHPASMLSKSLQGSLGNISINKNSMFVKSASATQLSLLIPPHDDIPTSPLAVEAHNILSPTSSASSRDQSPTRDGMKRPPYLLKRGASGYGFTMKTIKVYSHDGLYYTMHHLITKINLGGPAELAGLAANFLVTHINEEPTCGLDQPSIVKLIKSKSKPGAQTVTLRAVPLDETTIQICNKTSDTLKKAKMITRKPIKKRASYNNKLDRRRHRSSSLLKTLSKKNAESHGAPSCTTPDSSTHVPMRRKSPRSPRLLHMDVGLSQSFSSASSSPISSGPTSPGTSRPLSLRGLSKSLQNVISPSRRKSVHNIPLSPLARTPSPSPMVLSPTGPPPPSKLAVTGTRLSPSPSLRRAQRLGSSSETGKRAVTPPPPRISVTTDQSDGSIEEED